ncbi:MAG: hypothetical protein HKO66_10170 [Saprospiraceae bacterium]|nr:hypothetical protein [Bacteroidia bacterium]NNL92587.1 hypothetical protein [Saprospiraceae bacterium]
MNSKVLLLVILGLFFFSSCSDVENEIWINEDGSGKMEVKIDMSSMLEMASMFEGMGDEGEEGTEGDDEEQEEEYEIEEEESNSFEDAKSFDDIMDGIMSPENMRDIDTTFNMYDVMPDSIKNQVSNSELLKNINISVLANKAESVAKFSLQFVYKSQDELMEIFSSLSELDSDTSDEEKEASLDKFRSMMTQYEVDLKNGILTLPAQDFNDDLLGEGLGEGAGDKMDNMDDEAMGMMQMLFGDASIVTKIHLPGEVISCDDKEADIFGNQIRVKDSFMDLMKNKKTKGRVIKFKN